jgi:hypothetical protein
MIPSQPITVSKLDAARRQLRAAIRLWFQGEDPVAIHTLISAAHEIVHTLFKRAGLHGLMFDTDTSKTNTEVIGQNSSSATPHSLSTHRRTLTGKLNLIRR